EAFHIPLPKGEQYGFRVAACSEPVAKGLQSLADFGVVIDLAVEYDHRAAVFADQRLIAFVQILDAQANGSQGHVAGGEGPALVGAAVGYSFRHAPDQVRIRLTIPMSKTSNATHCRHAPGGELVHR